MPGQDPICGRFHSGSHAGQYSKQRPVRYILLVQLIFVVVIFFAFLPQLLMPLRQSLATTGFSHQVCVIKTTIRTSAPPSSSISIVCKKGPREGRQGGWAMLLNDLFDFSCLKLHIKLPISGDMIMFKVLHAVAQVSLPHPPFPLPLLTLLNHQRCEHFEKCILHTEHNCISSLS